MAGPVVAAAVVLCPGGVAGLADSKTLSAARRGELEPAIRARCLVGVGQASVAEIDRINILQATLLAMTRAVENLTVLARTEPTLVLVDGNRLPDWRWPARAIVGGDASKPAISAASIVAKETRDRTMRRLCERHPGYGFARHKGYGTAAHMAALARRGPCPEHRRSFAPVRMAEKASAESSGQHATR